MGTPEFALPTLELLADTYPVVGVVTQPDRRAGRGRRVSFSPVKEMALAEGIPVFQPDRLRKNLEALEQIRTWDPDVIVVAAYGQILPQALLDIPAFGALNVHASLLPRWRGASPIQGAILAGDEVTGVTIMKMDAGLDTGPILAQREVIINKDESAGQLEKRLAQVGGELLISTLPDYLSGNLHPRSQPEERVCHTHLLKKEDAAIDWQRSDAALSAHVRAFAPRPGAYTYWNGERFKVLKARALPPDVPVPSGPCGTVFLWDKVPAVITGQGALVLLQVQMAGKRPMHGDVFVHGQKEFVGALLQAPKPGET